MVKKFFAKAYLYLLLALLYAPIVLIIVFSFFNTSIFSFDNGFSFESYKSIFASDKTPELLAALKNTLIIAVVSSVVSTLIGTFSAIGIYCLKPRARKVVENVLNYEIFSITSVRCGIAFICQCVWSRG